MNAKDTRLYSRIDVTQAISRMATHLDDMYKHQVTTANPLVFVVIMKGAIPFYVYLSERLAAPNVVEYITVKSFDEYTAMRLDGSPVIDIPVETLANIVGRHVVILDDICDSGETLRLVKDALLKASPASIKAITLFYNNTAEQKGILDYLALPTHGKFIYGFGLDSHRGVGRNLRDIYVLEG